MPNLQIEMTEAELIALDMIAVDKQVWADNVLTNRARVAKEDLKATPAWAQSMAVHIQNGGDPEDDWGILTAGFNAGILKSAAQVQAEMEANVPETPGEEPVTPGTYNLPKQQPFIRATEEEAQSLEALLNSAPARLRMIYQGATHINSGDELFGTLMQMMSLALSPARAAELLAPL